MLSKKLLGARIANAGPAPVDPDFVLVVDTSTSPSLKLPLLGEVNCTVNWGDGTSNVYTSEGTAQHNYGGGGIFTVRISGTLTGFGANATTLSRPNYVRCLSFGEIGLTSLSGAFKDCENLIEVPSQLPPAVNILTYMFQNATSFNDSNITSWDTSNVQLMTSMFQSATAFNQDIGGWDTSKVQSLASMFFGATAFNQDIGAWDTSAVISMFRTFSSAPNFNQNISSWDTVKVTDMREMFYFANSFYQDLRGWCVGSFQSAPSLFGQPTGAGGFTPVWGTCPAYTNDGTITYIGASSGTTSATLPAHEAGDVIIAFGFRYSSTSSFTLPIGWSSIAANSGNTTYGRMAYRVATSSATTSGTWTNASSVTFLVYRGNFDLTAIAVYESTSTGTTTTVNYPTNNYWKDLGWTIAFSGFRINNTNLQIPPGDLTLRLNRLGSEGIHEISAFDSDGINAGWNSTSVSVGGSATGWRSYTLRLKNKIKKIGT